MKGMMYTDRNDYPLGGGDVPELLLRRSGDQHRVGGGGGGGLGRRRSLGGGEDGLDSLLVDKDGVEYDPNSLSWRYLGLYVDCDDNDNNSGGSGDGGNGDGGNGGGGSYCQRKLLWAAYLDKRYKQYGGNGIGDYQLYDVTSGSYDSTSCDGYGSSRCAKLDWHLERQRGVRDDENVDGEVAAGVPGARRYRQMGENHIPRHQAVTGGGHDLGDIQG